MSEAIRIIRKEHRNLAAVLSCLKALVHDIDRQGGEPDLDLFDLIFYYVSEFLNRYHHPKEDNYLYKVLRQRSPAIVAALDELGRQHAEVNIELETVREALRRYRAGGTDAFPQFLDAVETYCRFEYDHIALEESVVLPVAQSALLPQDWEKIDAAFAANDDPLFGAAPKAEFQRLMSRIAETAPAPHGLGPARKA